MNTASPCNTVLPTAAPKPWTITRPSPFRPLPPHQLWGLSHDDFSNIPTGTVKLVWYGDMRSTYFTLNETRASDAKQYDWRFDVPRGDIERSGPDNNGRYTYTYFFPKTEEGAYLYTMKACTVFGCSVPRAQDEPGTGRTRIFFNDALPVGLIDPYVTGSNKLTGYARDKDGSNGQTDVQLYANGQLVPFNSSQTIKPPTSTANRRPATTALCMTT